MVGSDPQASMNLMRSGDLDDYYIIDVSFYGHLQILSSLDHSVDTPTIEFVINYEDIYSKKYRAKITIWVENNRHEE